MHLSIILRYVCIVGCLLFALSLSACKSQRVAEISDEGMAAFAAGDQTKALRLFEEAIAHDPAYAPGYLGRGMVSWQRNQFEEALPDLDKAIALQPDLTWAYYMRGMSLMNLRRFEEGIADFEVVTTAADLPREDLIRAHRWYGIGLLNLNRLAEAADAFSHCITLQPETPYYRLERGQVYEVMGRREEAIADYKQFLLMNEGGDERNDEVKARLVILEREGS